MKERFGLLSVIMRFFPQDLEVDQLNNLPCHGLDLLDGVHPVVCPDGDPVGHLLLNLAVLVLVALLLNLQSKVTCEI